MRRRHLVLISLLVLSGTFLQGASAQDVMETGVPGTCIDLQSGRSMSCPVRTQAAAALPQSSADDEIVDSGVPGTCINMRTGRTRSCPASGARAAVDVAAKPSPPAGASAAIADRQPNPAVAVAAKPARPAAAPEPRTPVPPVAMREIPIEPMPSLNIMVPDTPTQRVAPMPLPGPKPAARRRSGASYGAPTPVRFAKPNGARLA